MNPISVAIKGKGLSNLLRRGVSITIRYGITPGRMDRALAQFAAILRQFECSATFPTTAVALQRTPHVIKKYQAQGIEFAIHGYRHLDHLHLSRKEQQSQLQMAKRIFEQSGIRPQGFRGPYLHRNENTLAVLEQLGFQYDGSQGLAWDVLDGKETSAYKRVLDFYGALQANDYPSLPTLEGDLVCIPYSLPDDEALVERLDLKTTSEMNDLWLAILRRTHELGELFTLGLHPERTVLCLEPLKAVLRQARSLEPVVWIARLGEIADWWRARTKATVRVEDLPDDGFRWTVTGPPGVTVLARGVRVEASTQEWVAPYQLVQTTGFVIQAPLRPWIGLPPSASPRLARFLRQQGYVVERSLESDRYAYYLDYPGFKVTDERSVLTLLEGTNRPLVRLGRWPNGAQSALAITGDIDALTLWGYGLRFVER